YCCVTPSSNFVRRFAEAPAETPSSTSGDRCPDALQRVALPAAQLGHAPPGSRTGLVLRAHHVACDRLVRPAPHRPRRARVRYAIRVPFGIELAGANRPGVHDFRLMRAWGGEPYTIADLRSAIAI